MAERENTSGFGKFGTLLVDLNSDDTVLEDFRLCSREIIKARNLDPDQAKALLRRDNKKIDKAFVDENGPAPTGQHVRGADLVRRLNDPDQPKA
jgi:hypothetical protein